MSTAIWRCLHCPDFSVPEGETRFESFADGDVWRVRVTRPLWELEVVRHWREVHPEQLAAVGAALATTLTDEAVEAIVRRESQAALDLIVRRSRDSIEASVRRSPLRSAEVEPPG